MDEPLAMDGRPGTFLVAVALRVAMIVPGELRNVPAFLLS
jgi:hypothetical protein